jgi:predicted outer membrane protein
MRDAPSRAMMHLRRSGSLLASALLCAGFAAACGGDHNEPSPGNDAADAAGEEGQAMGEALAAQAQDELAGEPAAIRAAHLGTILIALDQGEVEQAEAELELGFDAQVLDFALLMRDQHSGHADDAEDLLSDRGLAPLESSVSGALRDEAQRGIDELEHIPRSQVDFAYMRIQVKMHAAAGVLVERMIDLAPVDRELIDFLEDTRGAIEDHRIRAEAILRAR